jgi:hypothetical protein
MPSEEEEILLPGGGPKQPDESGPNPGSPGPTVPPQTPNPPPSGG